MQEIVYHTNYKLEDNYWWFVARNKIIKELTQKYSNLKNGDTVLDVGCGTGGFAESISDIYNPVCMDTSPLALDYCRKRGLTDLHEGVLSDFPKEDYNINGVFMLDVIEHIENDKEVVEEVYDLLPAGGSFIASVPAYMWLWSRHDKMHMHYRRYTKSKFNEMLKAQGFKIVYSSYFNTFLFPPAVLKRFYDKITGEKGEYKPVDDVSPAINKIFTKIFASEIPFLKFMRFPFGVSIVTIAVK
jgi:ubiquinone/menaquinone biosynthesis C-methylase UbiE